jgi:hypothetical protein
MGPCRSTLLAKLNAADETSQVIGKEIPADAESLVVFNPSSVSVFIRWGTDPSPIGVADPTSYDWVFPPASLSAMPIPADVASMSVFWYATGGGVVGIDQVVLVYSTPNNQGTFTGAVSTILD